MLGKKTRHMTQWNWRNEIDAMKMTQWKWRNENDAMKLTQWKWRNGRNNENKTGQIFNFWTKLVRIEQKLSNSLWTKKYIDDKKEASHKIAFQTAHDSSFPLSRTVCMYHTVLRPPTNYSNDTHVRACKEASEKDEERRKEETLLPFSLLPDCACNATAANTNKEHEHKKRKRISQNLFWRCSLFI